MAQKNLTPDMIPPGAILTYYGDIASGAIRPEDVRIEALTYRLIVNPQGQSAFETPKITIISRYSLAIRRVYGVVANPEFSGIAPALIRFNLREQGREFNVFKNPVTLSVIGPGGATIPFTWDGVYITVPGTDLETAWTIDAVLWAALVGTTKIAEVVVTGDYIACGPQA
jgi:hypothetical protein